MKKETLGTFFGQPLVLEVDETNKTIPDSWSWQEEWKNWLKSERKHAVEEYKNILFIKQLENKSKEMEKTLWFRFGKFMGWDKQ
jgi:hypothetical protein